MDKAESPPRGWTVALWTVIAVYAAAEAPLLIHLAARMFYRFPLNYNEGWNAMFAADVLAGRPLYVPLDRFPLTPNNYPPLSFPLIGGLGRLSGDLLLTGRIVALFSSALVGAAIYRIVANVTAQRPAGVLAALFWLWMMLGMAPERLVMYDPQMLGHAFALAALGLFSEWRGRLTARRVRLLALFCCVALFIKHLLVGAPLAIAAALFFGDRRGFKIFAAAGIAVAAAMLGAAWLYGRENLFSNFLDASRALRSGILAWRIKTIFILHRFIIAAAAFVLLLGSRRRAWTPYLFYFCLSFAVGAYVCRGVGVDMNAWFEFFIAAAIVFGIFAGSFRLLPGISPAAESSGGLFPARPGGGWQAVPLYAVLLSALLPLAARPRGLPGAEELRRSERAYLRQVALLRSIPGPALYEDLLLGFDAGKEFLYEPFNAAQQMAGGRMPESILTDAIARKEFGAIVLEADLDAALCGENLSPGQGQKLDFTTRSRWTENSLRAVALNYQPLAEENFPYYFYVPRASGSRPASPCLSGRPNR